MFANRQYLIKSTQLYNIVTQKLEYLQFNSNLHVNQFTLTHTYTRNFFIHILLFSFALTLLKLVISAISEIDRFILVLIIKKKLIMDERALLKSQS